MKGKRIVIAILNILFYVVLAMLLFICVTVYKSKADGKQPSILGYKFYVVLTGSMSPTIEPGDLIMDKTVEAGDIKAEDVITFNNENAGSVTTHRVKEAVSDNREFITQGDANNVEDMGTVKSENIQGKVVKVFPNWGSKIQFIQQNIIKIFAVIGAMIIITIIVFMLKRTKKESK